MAMAGSREIRGGHVCRKTTGCTKYVSKFSCECRKIVKGKIRYFDIIRKYMAVLANGQDGEQGNSRRSCMS